MTILSVGSFKIVPECRFHKIPSYSAMKKEVLPSGEVTYLGSGFRLLGIEFNPVPKETLDIKNRELRESAVEAFFADTDNVAHRIFLKALLPVQGPFVAVYDNNPAPLLIWINSTYLIPCPTKTSP